MAQVQFEVATYNYYCWSSRERGKVNLNLKGTGGQLCAVWFTEDPAAVLPDAEQLASSSFSFHFHLHQLPVLIDMLRNERPVFVYFNNDNGWPNSRISTADEPVGEGESRGG